MKITKFAVDRPITTAMTFLALLLFGFLAYLKLPINLMPEVNLPAMVIVTDYPGATPGEVESEITNLLEKEISTINGLKLMQSYSMPNTSMIITQFELNKDQDKAMAELRNKIDLVVSFLPKEAKLPFVRKRSKPLLAPFSMNSGSVVDLIVSGNVDANQLYQISRKKIKDKLARIDGVTKIEFGGGKLRQINIEVDKQELYDLGMNITDVSLQLQNNNVDMSGGYVINQDRESIVKTGHKYKSMEDIHQTFITTPYGEKLLTDFATIKDTFATYKTDAFYYDAKNDKEQNNIVSIGVQKSSTANAVAIAKEVKKLLPELQKSLPEGVSLSIPFDSSEYIESSVNDAIMNVVLGILITGLILFLFVNNIKATVIVSISIPVSLIINFIAINFFGGSLNMMSLMSFSVAIGALVSNSIVVLENILRLKKEGMAIKEASVEGTREVFAAVLASTGTNLVVFLPIANMNSIVGSFFKEYALAISFATIFSLLVSVTLTPMLASLFLKTDPKPSKFSNWIMSKFSKLEDAYEKSLIYLISNKRRPFILFGTMFTLFILSLSLMKSIGFEFEPESDNGDLFVELEMQPGTSLEKNREITKLVESKIANYEEVTAILSTIGNKNSFTTGSNYTNISVKLNKSVNRDRSNVEIGEDLLNTLKEIPEINPVVSTTSSDEGSGDIGFMIKSNNNQELQKANQQMVDMLKNIDGLISSESSLRDGPPLLQFKPNKRLLAELGISVNELALVIRSAITGIQATVLSENDVEYKIRIKVPSHQTQSIDHIKQLPIHTQEGLYTVGQLAEVSFEKAPAQILHKEKSKIAEFNGTLAPGYIMGDVRQAIDNELSKIQLPQSVEFKWTGNVEELDSTVSDMILTFSLALILMYMLLASLMESLWQPLIVFTTVPMALIGVFVIMFLFGTTMNIMSLMAIITLLGLVVNDDILIHDYSDQLIKRGYNNFDATVKSGKTKMKAVIMTTIAIIFGMLPNAIGLGDAGAEFRVPMAIVTIGGIMTSTILTLYLIPSLFYVIKGWIKKKTI